MVESMVEEIKSIVLDNGSYTIKIGFSGEDKPRSIIPSIAGTPNNLNDIVSYDHRDFYIGDEAQRMRGILNLSNPIERGSVRNWDLMEKIWEHTFYSKLKVSPDEHPVLLTEAPLNPKENRERMTQVMFETFNVPAMYIQIPAVLSLYSDGTTTGLVLDSGHGITHTAPIYDGFSIPNAVNKISNAGHDLTQFMAKLLLEKGLE